MAKRITLSIIGLFLVVAVTIASIWAIRYYTAKARGAVGVAEQIMSAEQRITAYNHFFDLCAAIRGHEFALDALQGELPQATSEKDRGRIQANITGLKSLWARDIAQYNADAQKDYTIGQFRDLDLPYQLPTDEYVKGRRTSCGK